jgi:hypothetical protein
MYMIEITEDKLHSLSEHVEKGLRHFGKVMQCIDELERHTGGAYGERGRLGEEDNDWWEEEEKKHKYGERYGNRMRRY